MRKNFRPGLLCGLTVSVAAGAVPVWGQDFQIVAERGDATPDGSDTLRFFNIPLVPLNNAGQVAFTSTLTASDDKALFFGDAGGLMQIARDGDTYRGGAFVVDGIESGAPASAFNDNGEVLFQASLDTPGNGNFNREAIILGDANGQTLQVIGGDPTPTGNGDFSLVTRRRADLSNSGLGAFSARLSGTAGGSGTDDRVIVRIDTNTGALTEIVRQGDAVPGGGTFIGGTGSGQFGSPTINDAGQIAFKSGISGAGLSDEGVFRSGPSGPVVVARAGGVGPGGSSIVGFGVGRSVQINSAGRIAFEADIRQGTDNLEAILYGDGSTLTEVARVGQAAPGGGALRRFNRQVAFNDLDQVLFESDITDNGIQEALLLADTGGLTEIARTGQSVPGGGATFSGISNNAFALNDVGGVAFQARFSDGTISNDDILLYYDADQGLREIARIGQAFQGSTIEDLKFSGTNVSDIIPQSQSGLNDAGQVAFAYDLANGVRGIAIWNAGPIVGDYNGDGFVSQADLDLVLLNWGASVVPPEWTATDQFDGVLVSQNELDGVLLNWGNGTPPAPASANAIPEPGTVMMLVGLVGVAGCRRRPIRAV